MALSNRVLNPSAETTGNFTDASGSANFLSGTSGGYTSSAATFTRISASGVNRSYMYRASMRAQTVSVQRQTYPGGPYEFDHYEYSSNSARLRMAVAAEATGTYTLSFNLYSLAGSAASSYDISVGVTAGGSDTWKSSKNTTSTSRHSFTFSAPSNTTHVWIDIKPVPTSSSANSTWHTDYYGGVTTSGNGGSPVEAQIDAIRFGPSGQTTYVDGYTPGYIWVGTPDASATQAALQLSATGTASGSGGSALVRLLRFATLTGIASSTGSLDVYRTGTEASGIASSTGSLSAGPYGPGGAAGTAGSTGSLNVYAVTHIGASGSATASGGLQAGITFLVFAAGSAGSSGSLDIGLPPDMTLSGAAFSAGELYAAIAGVTSAAGSAGSSGSLNMSPRVPVAAFDDFAIFAATGEFDPAMSLTAGSNGGVSTGANGADWVRVYGEFVAPDEYAVSGGSTLWQRAAYVVPGVVFDSVAVGDWQEFTQVQVEYASAGAAGPGIYRLASAVLPYVYPDRLNYAGAPIAITATPGPDYTGVAVASPLPGDTAAGQRVELKPATTMAIEFVTDRLRPGAYHTVSMYVQLTGDVTDAGFEVREARTGRRISPEAPSFSTSDDAPEAGAGWRRLSTTFRAPADGTVKIVFDFSITEPHTVVESFTIAGFLLEEGIALRPYFSYQVGDIDYRYKHGLSDGSEGTWHYEDYIRRSYILNQALTDYAPAGVDVEYAEFGRIPHFD